MPGRREEGTSIAMAAPGPRAPCLGRGAWNTLGDTGTSHLRTPRLFPKEERHGWFQEKLRPGERGREQEEEGLRKGADIY